MITVFFHNVRSLSLHIGDIVIDDIIKNNDVIGFIYKYRIDIVVLQKFNANVLSTLLFFKYTFLDRTFTLMLVDREQYI